MIRRDVHIFTALAKAGRCFPRTLPVMLVLFLAIGTAHCGTEGTFAAGVISGEEATDIIADAVFAGQLLCTARRGTLQNATSAEFLPNQILLRELGEPYIQQSFDINPQRGYRLSDVNNCADKVRDGLILSPDCGFEGYRCYLNPVNPWTGGN